MKNKKLCQICNEELSGMVATSPDGKITAHTNCFMIEMNPEMKNMSSEERLKFAEDLLKKG